MAVPTPRKLRQGMVAYWGAMFHTGNARVINCGGDGEGKIVRASGLFTDTAWGKGVQTLEKKQGQPFATRSLKVHAKRMELWA